MSDGEKDEDFAAKYFILVLNSAGIPLEEQKHRELISMLKYYILYSFIFITISQVLMLRNFDSLHEAGIAISFIFNGIFMNTTTAVLHLKKQNFINILQIIRKDFDVSASARFKKFFFTYGVTYFSIYSFMLLPPVLFFPLSGRELDDPNALLVPCWFPWNVDTYLKYILTNALEFSWLCALSVPVTLSFMLTAYFLMEVEMQFDFLCRAIRSTEDTHVGKAKFELNDSEMLKMCIRRHQITMK